MNHRKTMFISVLAAALLIGILTGWLALRPPKTEDGDKPGGESRIREATSAGASAGKGGPVSYRPELPVIRPVERPRPQRHISKVAYIGDDGRLYSTYDTDGDGLFDADEIVAHGTLMYDARTSAGAPSIEYMAVPNPDDTDADGLPDDWEIGYLGNLDSGPNDDPDRDGFPNRVEFARFQSPVAADLIDVRLRPENPQPAKAGSFSTASREFWDKQAAVAEQLRQERAISRPATRPAAPSYVWKQRPVKLGRVLKRTCPAVRPWSEYVKRSPRPEEDTDGDTLPDAWERQYFGHLKSGRFDDLDRDGFPNIIELYRGTDPARADRLPSSMKPKDLILLAPPEDNWDLGWDIRDAEFWRRQEMIPE